RDSHRDQCIELAEHSKMYVDLADIQLPSGGNWSIVQPLKVETRGETMKLVVRETKRLLENVYRTFTECERYSAKPPEFVLGELEPELPAEDSLVAPLVPLDFGLLEPDEQSFIAELCREAGRDVNNFELR